MSDSEDEWDDEDDNFGFEDEKPEPHEVLYKQAELLGVSRALALQTIGLCGGNLERAQDVIQEFHDLKRYLTTIGFANQDDDVLLQFVHKRRGIDRPTHPLSNLTADMDWFVSSPMFSALIDQEKSLCSQETIINAVCGDNPVCYETVMGFNNMGNASFTQRLSRRLLRFVCNCVSRWNS